MPKKKANSQFPDELYVQYVPDDNCGGYFEASSDASAHAYPNGRIRIGVYRLERVADVTAEVLLADID